MSSLASRFSHIYIEKEVSTHFRAQEILDRFPSSKKITIDNYKEIFSRPKQDWRLQKKSSNLILAKKRSDYLYLGSGVTPDFGHQHFFYNSLVLNCIYDCEYCYLQGMYPSANIVTFVNLEDYFEATKLELEKLKSLYLCISYDTDLLAFENIIPYCKAWIEFAKENPEIQIELRTKSANYKAISCQPAISNFILAWTLSPHEIQKQFESKTPTLKARLKSLRDAMDDGWPVRLCFDPVIIGPNWHQQYRTFLEEVRSCIPFENLHDLSIGSFRMNSQYFDRVIKQRPASELLNFPYARGRGMVEYDQSRKSEIKTFFEESLIDSIPPEKMFFI